jgi:hypothetical protein
MLFHTIKAICISLLLIVLIHYLYFFLKDTLTVPKIKDLVNKPAKRYDEMFEIMTNNRNMQELTSLQGQGMQESRSMQEPTSMQELTSMQGQGMQEQGIQGQGIQGQGMQEPTSLQNMTSIQGQGMQGQGMQGPTSLQGQGMQKPISMQGPTSLQKPISMQGQGMQGQGMQKPTSMQEELNNFLNELKKPGENSVNMTNKFPSAILENSLSFPTANDLSSGAYAPY